MYERYQEIKRGEEGIGEGGGRGRSRGGGRGEGQGEERSAFFLFCFFL